MGKGSACQPVPGRPMVVCLQNIMSNRDLAQLARYPRRYALVLHTVASVIVLGMCWRLQTPLQMTLWPMACSFLAYFTCMYSPLSRKGRVCNVPPYTDSIDNTAYNNVVLGLQHKDAAVMYLLALRQKARHCLPDCPGAAL